MSAFDSISKATCLSLLSFSLLLSGCGGDSKSSNNTTEEPKQEEPKQEEPKQEGPILKASEFRSGKWETTRNTNLDIEVWNSAENRFESITVYLDPFTVDILDNGVSGKAKINGIRNRDNANVTLRFNGFGYEGFVIGEEVTITGAVEESNVFLKFSNANETIGHAIYGIYDSDIELENSLIIESNLQGVFFINNDPHKAGESYISALTYVTDTSLTEITPEIITFADIKKEDSNFANGDYSGSLYMYITDLGDVNNGSYLDTEITVDLTFTDGKITGTGIFDTPDGLIGIAENDPVTITGNISGSMYEITVSHGSGWEYYGIGSATDIDAFDDSTKKITKFETDYGAGFPTITTRSSEFELEIELTPIAP